MITTNEISLVTVPVAHFGQFDVITKQDVSFRIFLENDRFKAVPQITAEERKTTGMPEELIFGYRNHVVLAAKNMEEETLNVIKNIILELEVLDLV